MSSDRVHVLTLISKAWLQPIWCACTHLLRCYRARMKSEAANALSGVFCSFSVRFKSLIAIDCFVSAHTGIDVFRQSNISVSD